MSTVSQVFIPSKGRAGLSRTIPLILEDGLVPTLFVEPQEATAYKNAYPSATFAVLPERDQGIGYVRQFILEFARKAKLPSYWMLDDDITGLYLVASKRITRAPASQVLGAAEKHFRLWKTIGQGGLEYGQFAWSATKPRKFNGYCDVAVWINVAATMHVNYRRHLDLKEDRDFTLQILASGFHTMRSAWTAFTAPKNGSNKGGLHEEYARVGREAEASKRMCETWPGLCTPFTKSDGRPDVKIDWSQFRERPPGA